MASKSKKGKLLLRAQFSENILYKIFNVGFCVLFFAVFLSVLFNNKSRMYDFSAFSLFMATVLGVLLLWLIMWAFCRLPNPGKKAEIIFLVSALVIFTALISVLGWQLRPSLNEAGGFGTAYLSAEAFVNYGTVPEKYFFEINGVNRAFYLFLCAYLSLFKLLGLSSFYIPVFILSVLCISSTMLLIYFSARKIFAFQRAALSLLLAAVCPVFLLGTPFFYTYTFSLPVPIAAVLIWLTLRKKWRGGKTAAFMVQFGLLSLMLGITALINKVTIIVFIAILLDLVFILYGKKRFFALLLGPVVLVGSFIGVGFLTQYNPAVEKYNAYDVKMPFNYSVMLGLGEEEQYYGEDYTFINENANGYVQRMQVINSEIGRRISDLSFGGALLHLSDKLSMGFGQADYGILAHLSETGRLPGIMGSYLTDSAFAILAHCFAALQLAMYFWVAISAIIAFKRGNFTLSFIRLALFGLILVYLFFNPGAESLIAFVPLCIIAMMEFLPVPKSVVLNTTALDGQEILEEKKIWLPDEQVNDDVNKAQLEDMFETAEAADNVDVISEEACDSEADEGNEAQAENIGNKMKSTHEFAQIKEILNLEESADG